MAKPEVFIGSAGEDLEIVKHLQRKSMHTQFRYHPWTELDTIKPGEYTVPALIKCFDDCRGAIFLAFGVDKTWWRGTSISAARDNVILEAGLAISKFGTDRTMVITDKRTHLPSDFLGSNPLVIEPSGDAIKDADDLHAHVEAFFKNKFIPAEMHLSYDRPERFPELTWERLAQCFDDLWNNDIRQIIILIERGAYQEAKKKVHARTDAVALYFKARIAVLTSNWPELSILSRQLLTAGITMVESGKHDAYFFVEVAARRLVKFFKDTDWVREQLLTLKKVYSPPDLSHLQGLVEMQAKRYPEAIKYYDEAIGNKSHNVWSHLDRAQCYAELGDNTRLEEAVRDAERLYPDAVNVGIPFQYRDIILGGPPSRSLTRDDR